MRTLALAAVAALLLAAAGCLEDGDGGDGDGTGLAEPPAEEGGVRFVALGDFGTGEEDQRRVAAAIGAVCAAMGCDFAVGLGDAIYPAGARSPDDPQFDTKFEEPYADLGFPFWIVLGNHDNGQDPAGATAPAGGLGLWYTAGNNEVAYAQRTDRASDKWTMPARHYSFSEGGLVDFVGLDTNTLVFYGVPVPPDAAAAVQEQEAAIPQYMAEARSPWKVALGHHPYVSNGPHGNAGEYDTVPAPGMSGDHLKEVFEEHLCDRIDLYLAGHDHNLQWLEPVPSCGRTHFIVSGGGGGEVYPLPGDSPAFFQEESLGFWWLHLTEGELRAVAYDAEAQALHDATIAKPIP